MEKRELSQVLYFYSEVLLFGIQTKINGGFLAGV
jgi:hypothetical protein